MADISLADWNNYVMKHPNGSYMWGSKLYPNGDVLYIVMGYARDNNLPFPTLMCDRSICGGPYPITPLSLEYDRLRLLQDPERISQYFAIWQYDNVKRYFK